jgi:hypothetical protein
MSFTVRFVTAPLLTDQSTELCEEFVGLEVPLSRLDSVGVISTKITTREANLSMSDGHQLHPNFVVVKMEDLITTATENHRDELAKYLKTFRMKKLLVPRTLVNVF